jgi:DNA-binding CsgD family transcriptional regulator
LHDDSPLYWESHLSRGHIENLPVTLKLWYEYNYSQQSRERREEINREAIVIIKNIIECDVTARQREITLLYFFGDMKQVPIARQFGISQPTVNQHLKGKMRGGKRVGGAIRRIRKVIRWRASTKSARTDGMHVVQILGLLLEEHITRRRAARLLGRAK